MNIDSMIQGNPQALVTSYNGVLVADSLEVADRFGKRHTHVLRSIDDLINQLESQSTQNWADYFIPDDYQDNKNRTQRRFKLTRDGFSLLVMGFTGPAALHWKLLYIEAFNKAAAKQYVAGNLTYERYNSTLQSYMGMMKHNDCYRFKMPLLEDVETIINESGVAA